MASKKFQNVALIGRAEKNVSDTLDIVADYLLSKKLAVFIEEKTAELMGKNSLPTFSEKKIPANIDLMIVVGGDGSLLTAAHCALPYHLPVLGINRGRLGFLTDIHPNQLSKIADVLSGKYLVENRFLLKATNGKKNLGVALNEVVLLPGDAQLIEFDIFINNQFVCQQRADGLIVSTPTGSTAYALSGGGPILHPQLNAIVLVPMFPHTLSNRPIVVEGDALIELVIRDNEFISACISCDGQHRIAIQPGDRIRISKQEKTLQLIHPDNYDYYATLREKLGWNTSC
ncbi:MAG: NAD kinase [Gammaproteobacteria bacterium RIFCSPHIGHO2_02_FULL_39_13]|nr:MAG: NAD kinase [Gammaproteobacteria bacterium RIFCSPHIGHO2_02_FULL_39_13]OGT49261.1 MAG: NAD kinase [Gammaproteobacteria bacterium RIFCSPHIGHO2_12_FULL_39_24]